ncbi:MAG: hypothetical protein AAF558_02495 [Verrucomicrobiota bacterium]
MTPHQVKEGFMSLPPKARRELALWIMKKEFTESDVVVLDKDNAESVKTMLERGSATGEVSTTARNHDEFPLVKILAIVLAMVMTGALAYIWKTASTAPALAEEAPADLQAEPDIEVTTEQGDAANLEFLNANVGREVVVRGVPKKAEVGFLYFHEDPKNGVQVKLISGGVVVFQSTDLDIWVKEEQELEIRGELIQTEDGNFQISVDRQIQVKLVESD